jgi:hypothetical protein
MGKDMNKKSENQNLEREIWEAEYNRNYHTNNRVCETANYGGGQISLGPPSLNMALMSYSELQEQLRLGYEDFLAGRYEEVSVAFEKFKRETR